MEFLTLSNIVFILGLLGVVFGIYRYFRDPQVDSEKKDALIEQRVQWQIESTDRKFKDIESNFKELLLQNNNHIHTIDVKIDSLVERYASTNKELVRLATIIDERIPKKHGV